MKLRFTIYDLRAVGFVLFFLGSLLPGLAQPKSGLQIPPQLNAAQAQAKGRELVANLLSQKPAQDTTNTGVLLIRDAAGHEREIPVRFAIFSTPTNWVSTYETTAPAAISQVRLTVLHNDSQPNEYLLSRTGTNSTPTRLSGNETMVPFADSDFWVGDLGLEFFHWPKQLVVKQELRRSQSCNVLESYNPHPAPGAYSRVVSWIGIESGGIIFAQAYDVRGQLLKQFVPKSVKKVEGQWQLEEMEIENRQTDSSTRIQFHLK